MRSKGAVDVGAIARAYGGGGHKNAAGCSARGELAPLQADVSSHCSSRQSGSRVADVVEPLESLCMRRRARRQQAGRPELARRRGRGATVARHQPHRPHRHARSAGVGRAAARPRAGDAAGAASDRVGQGVRGDRSASASSPTRYDAAGQVVAASGQRCRPRAALDAALDALSRARSSRRRPPTPRRWSTASARTCARVRASRCSRRRWP